MEKQSASKILITVIFLALAEIINAQSDKKFIRQGNREYEKDKYSEAETSYRRAIDKNKGSADAVFNIGDALYKQNKFDDAGKQFVDNHYLIEDKEKKSASLYNLGNSLLMANKVQESIEAFKGSLKLNPSNMEAKYNLAYAQDLLKQQQQKNQEQQDQNKNGQNKDQNEKQGNKDQEQNQDQNKEQQQQQQEQQQEISKEDAQRLLNALANDEKNVQEKVKLAKAMKAKVRTVKNW
ncbi:MAG: tetratricopeptide repeat protein [Bacteroidales bacterium]|nr:tetratricopeptide repeat protein [Bacteroidales bacterium]